MKTRVYLFITHANILGTAGFVHTPLILIVCRNQPRYKGQGIAQPMCCVRRKRNTRVGTPTLGIAEVISLMAWSHSIFVFWASPSLLALLTTHSSHSNPQMVRRVHLGLYNIISINPIHIMVASGSYN